VTPPPPKLDGADVLRYAVSERGGYYDVEGAEAPARVMAMAICQYRGDALFYYFSCTADWDVVGDFDCESIDDAMRLAAQHANGETLNWVSP
jgi:hypothetical protein